MESRKVSIIGGAGHVGLGLGLVLARAGYTVYGIDPNEDANRMIMSGQMPFVERGGTECLREVLAADRLHMMTSAEPISDSEVVVVILGTPIDGNLNPDLRPLYRVIREDLCPNMSTGQLILLRSTVSPGTTERVKALIEELTEHEVGKDVFLAYTPERVVQTRAIEEITTLPQLIGGVDPESEKRAVDFYNAVTSGGCETLTPVEAEIAKLMTNMARYVEFALANEFYMIAESYGANIHRIIDASTRDYSRLRLFNPGPNVGGPCLYKDGFYLVERIPFPEMISTAFKINEGMPMHLIQQLSRLPGKIEKVGVLGISFKADCDDTRNSVSYKLLKQLERGNYRVVAVDPYVPKYASMEGIEGCDALVLMTPHKEFRNLRTVLDKVANPSCWVLDIWGFWPEMRGRSKNGLFRANEIDQAAMAAAGATA